MATPRKTSFKNIYVIDTNIILNDIENIFLLSQNGDNLIVIPETVLDETDSFKSGFSEINYQAREFARLYDDSEILQIDRNSNKKLITIYSRSFRNGEVAYINVISKRKYDSDADTGIASNIKNDRKIIEIARDVQLEHKNTLFVSLDTMAKIRALSIGVEMFNLKATEYKLIQLYAELTLEHPLPEYKIFDIESMDVPQTVQSLCITDPHGKPNYYYRTGGVFKIIDEPELNRQEVNPQNMGQKVLASQMLDEYYNVVVSDSPAGCVLPGTTIDVEFDEKFISANEIKEMFNISNTQLGVLRKANLVRYDKIGSKNLRYYLSDFNKVVRDYLLLTPSQKIIFNNDKKYTSKYLKLQYWMGTNKSLTYSLGMLKKLRYRYLKYFEPDIDELVLHNFKPENIHNTIIKVQQKILAGIELPFSNMTDDFWLIRGYTAEESKQKVSQLQKERVNNKLEKYTQDDFKRCSPRCVEYWESLGYSKIESITKIKQVQNTFSLEKCVDKMGLVDGVARFTERQKKWQDTLNAKSIDEKHRINKAKGTKAGTEEPNYGSYTFKRFEENPELSVKTGYIYYISIKEDGDTFYKIGVTTDLYRRVSSLNGVLIWSEKSNLLDCFSKEQFLLEKYKEFRVTIPGVSTEIFNTDIMELECR